MNAQLQDLIAKALDKDARRRITVRQMMVLFSADFQKHPWVTYNGQVPLSNDFDKQQFRITETDINRAVTTVKFVDLTYSMVKLKRIAKKTKNRVKVIKKFKNRFRFNPRKKTFSHRRRSGSCIFPL